MIYILKKLKENAAKHKEPVWNIIIWITIYTYIQVCMCTYVHTPYSEETSNIRWSFKVFHASNSIARALGNEILFSGKKPAHCFGINSYFCIWILANRVFATVYS